MTSDRARAFVSIPAGIIFFLLIHVSQASATTLTVPGQYGTVAQAVGAAGSGDTILISPGMHAGAVTLNKAVTLQGSAFDQNNPKNNTAVINGGIIIPSGVTGNPVIRGVVIRGAGSCTLANSPFTIEYSYLTGCGDIGEYERGSGGISRGNVYEGSGDDGIDLDNQIQNITIENNIFLNSNDDGIEMRFHDDNISSVIDVIIRNNRIEGSGEDGIQFIDYHTDTKRRITVQGNLIMKSKDSGIGFMGNENTKENFEANSMREEVRIIGNTLVNNTYGITGGDNVLAINNIIMGTTNIAMKNIDGASRVSHTLFWNNGTDNTGSTIDAATTVNADPKLDTNYHPGSGSPAIDSGIAQYSWTNLFGQPVSVSLSGFAGSAPDRGWTEGSGGGANQTPTPGGRLQGDVDGDGDVDIYDYNQLVGDFAKTGSPRFIPADIDGDGDVDIYDYNLLVTAIYQVPK